MDPRDRLKRGEKASREGRYEDALKDFIWFHEHALEHDAAYYGVRLSFALASWLELARSFPPAHSALVDIRDRKAAILREGGGDRNLFHDVESINERLGAISDTYDLFLEIEKQRPEFASECVDLAFPALIAARDFARARRYLLDPERTIRSFAAKLNENIVEFAKRSRVPEATRQAFTRIYTDEIAQTVDVLAGVGEESDAIRLTELAIELVEDQDIRSNVETALRGRQPNSA